MGVPKNIGAKVREQIRRGVPTKRIAKDLGVRQSTVSYHAKAIGLAKPVQRKYDWDAIRIAYEGGQSLRECMAQWGFQETAWASAIRRGLIVSRYSPQENYVLLKEYLTLIDGKEMTSAQRHSVKAKMRREKVVPEECSECKSPPFWNGKPLNLHLDHADGDNTNNKLRNLRLLCPNCHSQTETYGWRNAGKVKGRGELKVSVVLLDAA